MSVFSRIDTNHQELKTVLITNRHCPFFSNRLPPLALHKPTHLIHNNVCIYKPELCVVKKDTMWKVVCGKSACPPVVMTSFNSATATQPATQDLVPCNVSLFILLL